jgi:hypothetical protein
LLCAFFFCACNLQPAGGVESPSASLIFPAVQAQSLPVKEFEQKWLRMGGTWNVANGRAFESRGRSSFWDYHELMNFNGLVTDKLESDFTEITSKISLSDVKVTPVEMMLAFDLQSPEMYYFYHFFAVKFIGDKDSIKTVSIIRSDRIDDTLPVRTKKNYKIETLYEQPCELEFGHDYDIKVAKTTGKTGDLLTLYIDGKKIFAEKLPLTGIKGKFALSARGASLSIDYVIIKNRAAVIFTDDFSENSIFVPTVKAQKVEK